MWITIKIAWKNIWRNKVRSLVVIGSIIVGVWSVIFLMSFSLGMGDSYVRNAVKNQYAHIQIHHPEFIEDQEVRFTIELKDQISSIPNVKNYSARIISNGMLSTGHGAKGVFIKGIIPDKESKLSDLDKKIVEGDYLSEDDTKGLLVSKKMIEKFKLKLKSRVVLTIQDQVGTIKYAAYKVSGIYSTGNSMVDESQVFVNEKGLRNLILGDTVPVNIFHEIAIEVSRPDSIAQVESLLQSIYPRDTIQNYKELAPDLALMETQIRTSGFIFIFIFMLALIFGIINTMLMAVLERYRELGMLQAIGMPKLKVFGMVVWETIFMCMAGVPVGFFLGWISVYYFQGRGLDLSAFSKGNEQFGIDSIIYPITDNALFTQLGIAVAITSILAAIYPAIKAVNLRPVEAIRKI
ncbi:MAG: FtsX-like permease family protein [Saprospiraceae bacterium]